MASTINADNGVVSGSAGVKTTADTSGVLALQSNGTTGLSLNTSLALGVGSGGTSYGSSGQVLASGGSSAVPVWTSQSALSVGSATTATTATSAASLATTNFSIVESGGKLYFKYGATNIASLDSSGNLIVLANVTAYGTP